MSTTARAAALRSRTTTADPIELEARHGAHNYHPLPVVISRSEGV